MKNKINKLFSTRQFRNGSYTSVVTVVIIAIIIVINMLFAKLPSSVRNIDISSTNIYNITDVTRNLLDSLDKSIDIIVVAEDASVDTRIKRFLKIYEDYTDKITISYEDPVMYPSVLTKYDTSENTVVVRCEETDKQEIIYFDDIIVYDAYSYYYSGSYVETEFDGEGQLTSAINLVSSDDAKKIYTVEGHAEETIGNSMSELIQKSNFTSESINLFKDGAVPEDCELLICNSPAKDFSEDEISVLKTYMDNGGSMILITALNADTPNLDEFMEEYGLEKVEGNIADTRQAYMGNPYYIIPTISQNEVTASLSSDSAVLLFNAAGVVETDNTPENVTVTPFLTTSSSGFAVTEDSQVQGTYILGAVSEKSTGDDISSRLTVFTTNTIINEQLISQYANISNSDVFINAITSNFDDVLSVSVEPVSLEVTYNTVSNQSFWGIWMVIVIPLGVLIYGFVRWILRRRL